MFGESEARLSRPRTSRSPRSRAAAGNRNRERAALRGGGAGGARARRLLAIASHELKAPLAPLLLRLQNLQRLVGSRPARYAAAGEGPPSSSAGPRGRSSAFRRPRGRPARPHPGYRARSGSSSTRLRSTSRRFVREDRGAPPRRGGRRGRHALPSWRTAPCRAPGTGAASSRWIANLLTNATKYAPGGARTIEVPRRGAEAADATIVVREIAAPASRRRTRSGYFRPFERGRPGRGRPRRPRARALRLSVRQIVEAHGGIRRRRERTGAGDDLHRAAAPDPAGARLEPGRAAHSSSRHPLRVERPRAHETRARIGGGAPAAGARAVRTSRSGSGTTRARCQASMARKTSRSRLRSSDERAPSTMTLAGGRPSAKVRSCSRRRSRSRKRYASESVSQVSFSMSPASSAAREPLRACWRSARPPRCRRRGRGRRSSRCR